MSWWAHPSNGRNVLAFGGGGGSARTGVNNSIVVSEDNDLPVQISTGSDVAVATQVYQNPQTGNVYILAAMGSQVKRYHWPQCDQSENPIPTLDVGEGVNALAVHIHADRFAVGCDSGIVKVFQMSDDNFAGECLYELSGHTKAVCGLSFSIKDDRLISSAKDGTARIYHKGELVADLQCSVEDPKGPPSKRNMQVLVRGCAFADLEGKLALTVASPKRGKAFLGRWVFKNGEYFCTERSECSPCPISSMSMTQDADFLALGAVDGSIIIWNIPEWRPKKKFSEVHELPVTCIAARPFKELLRGEDDGIRVDARSASADSQLGLLTLQRRGPKKASQSSGTSWATQLYRAFLVGVLAYALSPIFYEAQYKCGRILGEQGPAALPRCVLDQVIISRRGPQTVQYYEQTS